MSLYFGSRLTEEKRLGFRTWHERSILETDKKETCLKQPVLRVFVILQASVCVAEKFQVYLNAAIQIHSQQLKIGK